MKGARILLLDDNREARWPLAGCLRRAGAVVTEADDGSDGMRLLGRHAFDRIIADVGMPRLGGFGLFSEMRFGDAESARYRHIPVILVTGQVGRGELARGMEAGLEDFVTKPVDLDEFRARVNAVLRRASASARPTARTQGDLQDLRMAALTQALHLGCSSGRLCIRSGTAFGLIDFQRGHIAHAVYTAASESLTGDEAALMALGIDTGTFEILPVPETAPRTVFRDTQGLLLRAATHADEYASREILARKTTATVETGAGAPSDADAAPAADPDAPPADEAPRPPDKTVVLTPLPEEGDDDEFLDVGVDDTRPVPAA